jgi:hypothetical protein
VCGPQSQDEFAPGGRVRRDGVEQDRLADAGRAVQGDAAARGEPGLDSRQQRRAADQGRRVLLRVRVQGCLPS